MKTGRRARKANRKALPASAQRSVFIALSGDDSPRLVDEIKAHFFALDGVELVADMQDASMVVVIKHRATDEGHAVSIVALFIGIDGALNYLGDELVIDDSDKSAARRLAAFFNDQVLASFE